MQRNPEQTVNIYADVYRQKLADPKTLEGLSAEASAKLKINLGRSFLKQSQQSGAEFMAVKITDKIILGDGTVLTLEQAKEQNLKYFDLT
jgi:hypothetical protein